MEIRLTGHISFVLLAVAALASTSCMVGPKYQQPPAPVPQAFKESPPEGWKEAQPNDGALRGKWWEIYNDPDLNALEEMISVSNQNVLAAEAQFRQARDAVRVARAALFPTVSVGTTASSSKVSGSLATGRNFAPPPQHSLTFPVIDFSYQADLWGSVRRTVRASAESAQVSAAQLENIRLLLQATLAQDYFALHGLDGDEDLLERTVKSYEEYLTLTKNRLAAGVATGGDVAQAEAQLGTAQAQLIDFGVARAQFEHAIAMLTGRPPSDVSISRKILTADPPVVPLSMP